MNNPAPKKSLGQHWLYDAATLEAVCDAVSVKPGETVLEIGPGLGTLTKTLLRRGACVTAVEFDAHLAANLTKGVLEDGSLTPGALQNLTVFESDILTFNLRQLPTEYKVVANIPYYLTSNLLRVLCESPNTFSQAALLIQKEVAERVCAAPGAMSLLSVSTQFYCEVSLGVFVPKELFTPSPKVDSQVLVLQRRKTLPFPVQDTKQFFRIVRAGFSQKRKTLLNSLSGGLGLPKQDVAQKLAATSVAANRRPQTLSLAEWYELYVALCDEP